MPSLFVITPAQGMVFVAVIYIAIKLVLARFQAQAERRQIQARDN